MSKYLYWYYGWIKLLKIAKKNNAKTTFLIIILFLYVHINVINILFLSFPTTFNDSIADLKPRFLNSWKILCSQWCRILKIVPMRAHQSGRFFYKHANSAVDLTI